MVWSFSQFVSLICGPHMGTPYSKTLLPIVLYVKVIISFSWPQSEPARDLSMLFLDFPLLMVDLTWWVKVCIVSNITPNNLGVFSRGRIVFFILMLGCIFASLVSGVKKVTVDFSGDTKSSLYFMIRQFVQNFVQQWSTLCPWSERLSEISPGDWWSVFFYVKWREICTWWSVRVQEFVR